MDSTPVMITLAGAAATILVSTWGLGWWLRGRFAALQEAVAAKHDEHELQDQHRHEDNLARFSRIDVALAQLGWRNGFPARGQS